MNPQHLSIILTILALPNFAHAQARFYYTGPSPTINLDACPIANCTQCSTGNFNLNCGLDSARLNPNNCQPCTGLPLNAEWLPWGAYPDGIAASTSICRWACKAGYSGNTASNPSTCTGCTMGYYAAAGATSCTPCLSGFYLNKTLATSQSDCKPCETNFYTTTQGTANCSPCQLCATGQYRTGCGSASAGTCSLCTNVPA